MQRPRHLAVTERSLMKESAVALVRAVPGPIDEPRSHGVLLASVLLALPGVVAARGSAGSLILAFSAIAACILWLLPPLRAVPLIMLLSVCNQLLSVGQLRNEMVLRGSAQREGALPYIAGGVIGVPIGLALLHALPTRVFATWLGLFLITLIVLVNAAAWGVRRAGELRAG